MGLNKSSWWKFTRNNESIIINNWSRKNKDESIRWTRSEGWYFDRTVSIRVSLLQRIPSGHWFRCNA
jgi:hypothetical protein